MRRTATLLLLAAIGVLAALAVADAVRPGSERKPTAAAGATTARPKPPMLAETLRHEGVIGFVHYADRGHVLHSRLVWQPVSPGISVGPPIRR